MSEITGTEEAKGYMGDNKAVHLLNVSGQFSLTDEQIRKASYEWCESEYSNIEAHSTEGSIRRRYFKSAIKWIMKHQESV